MNNSLSKLLSSYFNLIRRFLPTKPKGISIGIDISVSDCKLVALSQEEDCYELVQWDTEPIVNGDIGATIKKLLEKVTPPCKTVQTAVFGKGTLIRYIQMPFMPLPDLKKAFDIESDKYFPFPQDQIYTDCSILGSPKKSKMMDVLVSAVKRDMVDSRIKMLTDLGLQVDFIGLNPIALMNAFIELGFPEGVGPDHAVALLDMGESVSNLTVMSDGVSRFTRDIFIGGRDFTKRVSNTLGISFQEAEKLKHQPGAKSAEVTAAYESATMNIVQELKLSFDYFSTENNKEVSKLFLTGGGSMLTDIENIFERNLELKVGIWDPIEKLQISSQLDVDELKKRSRKLGVAVGLALYGYD